MMNRKINLLALLLAAMMLLGACSNTPPAGTTDPGSGGATTQPPGQTARTDLVIAIAGEPLGLVPQKTNESYSAAIEGQIYSTLMRRTPTGEIVADLATDYRISDDGLSYTFTLRDDVTFHNGERMTAEDVRFSFEIGMGEPQVADVFGVFEAVEAPDDTTLIIRLKYKSAALLERLSLANAAGVLCKSAYEAMGPEAYSDSPVGTGAFQLAAWQKGVSLTLERFEDCYRGKAPLEKVTFRFIPDATTATVAIEAQEIDFTDNPSLPGLSALDTSKIAVYEAAGTNLNWVAINTSIAPLDNALVRRAMEYAIDKQNVVDIAMDGHGLVAKSIAYEAIPGYDPTVGGNDYDVEKAKALMAQAGMSGGFEVSMLTIGGFTSSIAQVVQSDLAKINIKVNIETLETAAFLQDVLGGNYQLSYLGSGTSTYDADQMYQRAHPNGTYSVSFFSSDDLNEALATVLEETDLDIRNAAIKRSQELFMEYVPFIPLFWTSKVLLADARLINGDKMNDTFDLFLLSW